MYKYDRGYIETSMPAYDARSSLDVDAHTERYQNLELVENMQNGEESWSREAVAHIIDSGIWRNMVHSSGMKFRR
jgi:hypothetical protein